MATDVQICNLALGFLGVEEITALSDTTKQGVLCNRFYSFVKNRVLRQHPWNCAITRATLTDDGTTPDHEFTYAFALPTGFLRLWKMYEYDTNLDYKVEANKILAMTDEIKISYIKAVAESTFPDDLAMLIALELAIDLSYFLVQSETVRQGIIAMRAERLRDARSIDAQEGKPDDPNDDTFLNARL